MHKYEIFTLPTFQIIFVLLLLCFLFKEAHNIYKKRAAYFQNIWSYSSLVIVFLCLGSVSAFSYACLQANKLATSFAESEGNAYVNFQAISFWHESLTYLNAFITFVSILHVLHLLRFSPQIALFGIVQRHASQDMKYFFIMFTMLYLAFVTAFYLLFMDVLAEFRTFMGSAEECLQILLGVFNFSGIYESDLVLGPFLFTLFSVLVVFILISMMIAIMDESFGVARELSQSQGSSDNDMIHFMLSEFLTWTGLINTPFGDWMAGRGTSVETTALVASSGRLVSQVYQDRTARQLEEQISSLNETMDQFLTFVKRTQLVTNEKVLSEPLTLTSMDHSKPVASASTTPTRVEQEHLGLRKRVNNFFSKPAN
ncbi:unnamed protein product [Protopolystoma xenopodis]|uniref:Polycystin cation channel PKD1/PKD2 domain-containing protein n=1 Tax=Protopolystoma xenopodis TaxID=117903 RepID=A0A448XJX7_9PLAT|nr:unnamed protein product [Protopolystoma xenopodis]